MDIQVAQEVTDLLNKCEEMRKCKFIVAPTKIKDILKSIVNSAELHQLFSTVTKDFDYLAAKSNCFVTANDGVVNHSYILLPETMSDRLAFIFCLFVEFDRDSINFNNFLRKYFYEDGSYYASYQAFCDLILGNLERIVEDIYANELSAAQKAADEAAEAEAVPYSEKARTLSAISLSIAHEKKYVFESKLSKEDKEIGLNMLTEIEKAVKDENAKLIEALVCGYKYYATYNSVVSEGLSPLIELIAEYGSTKYGS